MNYPAIHMQHDFSNTRIRDKEYIYGSQKEEMYGRGRLISEPVVNVVHVSESRRSVYHGFSQREKKSGENGRFSDILSKKSLLFFAQQRRRGISGIAIFIVGALGARVWESSMYSDLEKFHTKSWTALTLPR